MDAIQLLLAAPALALVLGAGLVVHELSHAAALRALGVSYEVEWFPGGEERGLGIATGRWASVVPRGLSPDLAPWRLRVAALMPLTLALPLVLAVAGVLPNPMDAGDPVLAVAVIGWIGCALPSPQDFSLVWHADAAIERYAS